MSASSDGARPVVLLIDSYDAVRRAHADLLREQGFAVLEARNGVEGLLLAREQEPALVVVDLWPFFSASLRVVERLRRGSGAARVPVLVLTSVVSSEYRARALRAGCDAYLEKPCAPEQLLDAVRRATCTLSPEAA